MKKKAKPKLDKKELLGQLSKLTDAYSKADNTAQRQYIVEKIKDFIKGLLAKGFTKEQLNPVYIRLKNVNNYGKLYEYSLAENLEEQKTIIADSIQSSPYHLKKLELQNTAMITYPEEK